MQQQQQQEQVNPLIFPLELPGAGKQNIFSVLSWNTLASHLCEPKDFPKANPACLDFNGYRWALIKKIIQTYNSDIIVLQEVKDIDAFKQVLDSEYSVFWEPKSTDDGVLVAVRKSVFTVESADATKYGKDSQFFWTVRVQHTASQTPLRVYGTHLKAKPEFEEQRVKQIEFFLAHIAQKGESFRNAIFCGDFNTEPHSATVTRLVQASQWRCAYEGQPITTFKTRATTIARKIDYIFYDPNSVRVLLRSTLPQSVKPDDPGYPSFDMPSDHLPLYAVFDFLPQNSA